MPSPFPGMDPYLEDAELWPDVHADLITGIRAHLTPRLRPRYVARVEQHTFLFDPNDPGEEVLIVPDVRIIERPGALQARPEQGGGVATLEMADPVDITGRVPRMTRQRYIEIRDTASREVVTVIEIVSPWNKRGGAAGRRHFQRKREDVVQGNTSWLEIDLLREGKPTIGIISDKLRSHYRAYVDRTTPDERQQLLWPIFLRSRLPVLRVPLRAGEADVPLDLQAVLDGAYERAGYDLDVNYGRPPQLPLEAPDEAWADELLRSKGLRP